MTSKFGQPKQQKYEYFVICLSMCREFSFHFCPRDIFTPLEGVLKIVRDKMRIHGKN